MKKLISAHLVLLLTFCAASPVFALEAAARESVVVKEPIAEDLLAAGKTVRIEAAIGGDLAVSGAHVAIEAPVAGYALAAGREVEVMGTVGDDLWAAGATVLSALPSVTTRCSQDVTSTWKAARKSRAMCASLAQTLRWKGPSTASADRRTKRPPRFGSRRIGGSTRRNSKRIARCAHSRRSHRPRIRSARDRTGRAGARPSAFRRDRGPRRVGLAWVVAVFVVALVVVGFAALALFPVWAGRVASGIRERPGASAFTGFIGLVLTPFIVVLLLMTVVGIPLALILLALYAVAILFSGVFVAYRLGGWLLDHTSGPWLRMAVGALAVSFAISLPWVGWIAQSIVLVIGFGALTLERWHSRRGASGGVN